MRPTLAFAILLLGLTGAAPEPDYSSYFAGYLYPSADAADASLIEIESSVGRADRLVVAAQQPQADADAADVTSSTSATDTNGDSGMATDNRSAAGGDGQANSPSAASTDDLCNALFASALENDLPIPFFANLIWQESRLRGDAVSPKGAQGIAQFMPKVAAESGLDNPFDPMQAIPASARFLRELRLEFGNLGFVAAAYNAGARRVAEWLEHRGNLPRETRGYVMRVTGLSVDAWRSMAINADALTFVRHLPCRSLPAFASVEQAQSEQVQAQVAALEAAKADQAKTEQAEIEQAKSVQPKRKKSAAKSGPKPHRSRSRTATRERNRDSVEHREARRADHAHGRVRHEAERHVRSARNRHGRA